MPMNARTRGRQAKIQREAEGYLELGMLYPPTRLADVGPPGDPAKLDIGAAFLCGGTLSAILFSLA